MSTNLTLHDLDNGIEIQLWQTPTWVTWICLSHDPDTQEPDGGHEAVRRRYIQWVQSLLSVTRSEENFQEMKSAIHEHLKIVNSVKYPYFSYI